MKGKSLWQKKRRVGKGKNKNEAPVSWFSCHPHGRGPGE